MKVLLYYIRSIITLFFLPYFSGSTASSPLPTSSSSSSSSSSSHPLLGLAGLPPTLFHPHHGGHNNNNNNSTNNNNIGNPEKPKLPLPLSSPVQGEYFNNVFYLLHYRSFYLFSLL